MFLDFSGRRRYYPINETFGELYVEVLHFYWIKKDATGLDKKDLIQLQLNYLKNFAIEGIDARIETLVVDDFIINNEWILQKLLLLIAVLKQIKSVGDVIKSCLTIYFLDIKLFQLEYTFENDYRQVEIIDIYNYIYEELSWYYNTILVNIRRGIINLQPDFGITKYDNWDFSQKLLFFHLDVGLNEFSRPTQNFILVPKAFPRKYLLAGKEFTYFHDQLGLNNSYRCFKIELDEGSDMNFIFLQDRNLVISPLESPLQFNWCDKDKIDYIGSLTEESSPKKLQSKLKLNNRTILKNVTNNNGLPQRNLNMLNLFEKETHNKVNQNEVVQDSKSLIDVDEGYIKGREVTTGLEATAMDDSIEDSGELLQQYSSEIVLIEKSPVQENILKELSKTVDRLSIASMELKLLEYPETPVIYNVLRPQTTLNLQNSYGAEELSKKSNNYMSTDNFVFHSTEELKSSALITNSRKSSITYEKPWNIKRDIVDNWKYNNIETITENLASDKYLETIPIRDAFKQKYSKVKEQCRYFKTFVKYRLNEEQS
ncbi:hypothetical protein TPHA_0O00620 [Tetrapisispora phaffii CBS 4417]|uniref:Uncharacterized protein n=1 Tax=Tetrapisispora phaffii (strain ATCC 24235 / CBS 4417 / NBRC 1672 / NRRL Y-8282 / UCD 70-5) TaxID=1071381 RepID=G8C1K4_TETPH|nr:hypothetical protein TPHA_0O00620 [Tetrapisispora phaffii CBS 4417]CCE66032.1 hypothetical protein TPHA_0O00620 [Tetrapisispora phaffii CBS 4417]